MPHDSNGTVICNGDIVTMSFVATDICPQEDYCNVTLKGILPEGVPFDTSMNVTVTTNTKLVTLLRRYPESLTQPREPQAEPAAATQSC